MTTLVGELVELARGEERDLAPTEFRLDELVRVAVDRFARRAPGLSFRTELWPSVVTGVPERVERAVANLLDNARKWSPPGENVDVRVRDGLVEVRDRGPGIAAEDAPLVFNRFYRSAAARGLPGAGLGLSIVKQIADAHGGSVGVGRARDGGAILRLRLAPARAAVRGEPGRPVLPAGDARTAPMRPGRPRPVHASATGRIDPRAPLVGGAPADRGPSGRVP
jgi:two-component system sensor histidine kinase MprB